MPQGSMGRDYIKRQKDYMVMMVTMAVVVVVLQIWNFVRHYSAQHSGIGKGELW